VEERYVQLCADIKELMRSAGFARRRRSGGSSDWHRIELEDGINDVIGELGINRRTQWDTVTKPEPPKVSPLASYMKSLARRHVPLRRRCC
jgi:hypothetical protein